MILYGRSRKAPDGRAADVDSFVNDVVLDPFGGIGTTAKAALKLDRRFCTVEWMDEYIEATLDKE